MTNPAAHHMQRGFKNQSTSTNSTTAAPSPATDRSTATEAQIAKLIALVRRRPHHTHELRMMGISHPAGRVFDLTKRGYTLETTRVTTIDSDGFEHVGVALYSLISEPGGDTK